MPPNIQVAAFVFGAVLILIGLFGGGGFELFGAKIPGTVDKQGRIFAWISGILLIFIGLVNPFERFLPLTIPTPEPLAATQIVDNTSLTPTATELPTNTATPTTLPTIAPTLTPTLTPTDIPTTTPSPSLPTITQTSPASTTTALPTATNTVIQPAETISTIQSVNTTLLLSLEGHSRTMEDVAFSPDGSIIASAADDRTVRLWRTSDGKLLGILEHDRFVSDISFSHDGQILVTSDGTIKLWNVHEGRLIKILGQDNMNVGPVTFSPDGQIVASGNVSDGSIYLWRVSDGMIQATLSGHTSQIRSLVFSSDGQLLSSGSSDETVRVWNILDGSTKFVLPHEGWVDGVAFTVDGKTLATADGIVRLWNILDGSLLHTIDQYRGSLDVTTSPDNILAVGVNDGTIRLFHIMDTILLGTLEAHPIDVKIAFSQDGTLLVSGGNDNTVRLWKIR